MRTLDLAVTGDSANSVASNSNASCASAPTPAAIATAASTPNPPTHTDSLVSNGSSSSRSRSSDLDRGSQRRWRSMLVRDRRSTAGTGGRGGEDLDRRDRLVRDAASSIARGITSRRAQMVEPEMVSSARARRASRARATNNAPASDGSTDSRRRQPGPRATPGEMCSPRTPSAPARGQHRHPRACAVVVLTNDGDRSTRCSQLSSATTGRYDRGTGQPVGHRHALRRRVAHRGGDRVGQVDGVEHPGELGQPHTVGVVGQQLRADLNARRVLAARRRRRRSTPPRAAAIRDRRNISSRPTKLLSSYGRLERYASSERNGGNDRGAPGTSTWNRAPRTAVASGARRGLPTRTLAHRLAEDAGAQRPGRRARPPATRGRLRRTRTVAVAVGVLARVQTHATRAPRARATTVWRTAAPGATAAPPRHA